MSEPTNPQGSTPHEVPGESVTPAPQAPDPEPDRVEDQDQSQSPDAAGGGGRADGEDDIETRADNPDEAVDDKAVDEGRAAGPGPTVHDRRRVDPKTGKPRKPGAGTPEPSVSRDADGGPMLHAKVVELEELVAERTADLQRLQAEYANYKKRVDRDRAVSRQHGIEAVVLDLLPVLDSIEAAREHDELVGGFKLVADELARLGTKYGLEVYGEVGDVFDPQIHEALMHMPYTGEAEITETALSAVMQKGVRIGDRVLRPARVAVADPE